MMTKRPAGLAALAVAAVVAVAGCGGGGDEASKSAKDIVADATAAATSAGTVHVTGTASAQGQKVPVDVRLTKAGAVGTGSFAGTTVELIRVGDSLYVRGAQQVLGTFLGAAAAKKIDGHWVEIPAAMPQLQQFLGMTDFTELVTKTLTPTQTPTKVGTRTVDGKKAVAVRGFGTDGATTLVVAASGTAYPLQLVSSDGTLSFRDWGAAVTVQKPTDVVPLASLTG
jgi:hypothetical protein